MIVRCSITRFYDIVSSSLHLVNKGEKLFKALAILPRDAVVVGFERSVVRCPVPDVATVALSFARNILG